MPTHIALIRGVNVGGNRMVPMADLRALLNDIGLRNGATLLQSGNLVFDGGRKSTGALEKLLEKEAAKRLKLETDFYVYTADEWREVIAKNPLQQSADRDPSHFIVMFLRSEPSKDALRILQESIPGREVVRAAGKQLYIEYPDGMGTSKLGRALTEKRLGSRGTARNWNTVLKLAALTQS